MASRELPATGYAATTAVVILNWNGRRWLEQFLPSVLAHSDAARIVVADNASTDDSVAWLAAQYPSEQVQVLRLAENYGFCEGYNHALRQLPDSTRPANAGVQAFTTARHVLRRMAPARSPLPIPELT